MACWVSFASCSSLVDQQVGIGRGGLVVGMRANRPREGYRRQIERARQEAQQEAQPPAPHQQQAPHQHQAESHLAKTLLQKWAWGKLSTPEVQALAHSAFLDGLEHPKVRALASLGSWGKHPANMHRDLLRAVGAGAKLVSSTLAFHINLETQRGAWTRSLVDMILPHKLFASMYHERHQAFLASILGGDANNVRRFWEAMQTHPILLARPELRTRADLLQVIPIGLHGDGVSYMQLRAGGKSLEVLSWSSLLSRGPTKSNSFLIFLVVKSLIKETGWGRSWPVIWKVLSWSFIALAEGKWPMLNWDGRPFDPTSQDFIKKGQPLAQGFSAVLFVIKADIDFLANNLKLNHASSNQPCALCDADRSLASKPWTDCRSTAKWRETCWTFADWRRQHPHCHALFKIPGVGIDLVHPDLMHVKHLGVDLSLLGSSLMWLMKHYLPGTTEENLNVIWDFLKRWFKDFERSPHKVQVEVGSLLL